jgi:3-oxoacyl-[acyl-carrier-protein] synthase II
MGLISPLGSVVSDFWDQVIEGKSGVRRMLKLPGAVMGSEFGAEAIDFAGQVEDFGELDKALRRQVKKGLKVMCREIQMGVAAAQKALAHANLSMETRDPDRTGVVYGSDYMMTVPEEFITSMRLCASDSKFVFDQWAKSGIPKVDPLWLLKYLPNMPASHIAILNDLRGPNNSLTLREAAANLAVNEAAMTIRRGKADVMLAGATGTRVHAFRSIHIALQEPLAGNEEPRDAARLSRPFDHCHDGQVLGEGAGAVVLESLEHAHRRGATIYGEVLGYGSSCVYNDGMADLQQSLANSMNQAIARSGLEPSQLGHLHAHGLSTVTCDRAEAAAIRSVFGDKTPPVAAAKSQFGNLGAAGGIVELIVSLLALQADRLPAVLNFEAPDAASPLIPNTDPNQSPGLTFVTASTTPQGQSSAVVVRKLS